MIGRRAAVATGHRPPRLGGYGSEPRRALVSHARLSLEVIGPDDVVLGMAQGWDQAVAFSCVELGIPFVAALPFRSMGDTWPRDAVLRRDFLLEKAIRVEIVGGVGPYPVRFIVRDKWMVEHVAESPGKGLCLALWDGSDRGGTFATVQHAERHGLEIFNAWDTWDGLASGAHVRERSA